MTTLILGIALVVLVIGVLVGVVLDHLIVLPVDRRRLNDIAQQLTAEARISSATHQTLRAMRDAVRQGGRN